MHVALAPPSRWSTTGGGDATGEGNAEPMENETRLERWLERALARAETPRGGAAVIATITTIATVVFGLLMTVIDHKNFTTLGQGLWWSVQTVTTVGYGDHVPTNVAGRLVAALVMLLGLAFLVVITANTKGFLRRSPMETGLISERELRRHHPRIAYTGGTHCPGRQRAGTSPDRLGRLHRGGLVAVVASPDRQA